MIRKSDGLIPPVTVACRSRCAVSFLLSRELCAAPRTGPADSPPEGSGPGSQTAVGFRLRVYFGFDHPRPYSSKLSQYFPLQGSALILIVDHFAEERHDPDPLTLPFVGIHRGVNRLSAAD